MAFDSSTRGKLQRLVAACRRLLTNEFDDQLQSIYGIYADEGRVLELEKFTSLDDEQRATGVLLRDRINHLESSLTSSKTSLKDSVQRVLREQAFTLLNRFAALRMAEERELVLQCVGDGLNSKGFQVFENVASPDLGSQYERYRVFLDCLFDELSLELGVLFDRFSPFGLLFPREQKLKDFLALLNDPELKSLWREDETIGWIYQYFNGNDVKEMRDAAKGGPPRNSRELAVRNQFFTPRYVVEFLTDNSLGRLWYEMTKGQTSLKDQCRYFVRRPNEVFMGKTFAGDYPCAGAAWIKEVARTGDFSKLPENPPLDDLSRFALLIDGYAEIARSRSSRGAEDAEDTDAFARDFYNPHAAASKATPTPWRGSAIELWCALFLVQRTSLRHGWRPGGEWKPSDTVQDDYVCRDLWPALRSALQQQRSDLTQEELLREPVFIPDRPLKDPREVRLLDPACGSMHFGLYAFDLFTVVYEEWWDTWATDEQKLAFIEDLHARGTSTGAPITDSLEQRAFFARHIPRLIIEHNLHGIDIDPRAAQIAGLSLWLRAHRAWQRTGVKPADRPRISRSNLVCAEPMPGEKELLREFVEGAFPAGERPAFAFLLGKVFDAMTLAGEAGSLLRIEEEIRTAIAEARALAQSQSTPRQASLFAGTERPEQEEFNLRGLTSDEQFWEKAEERIYEALETYAGQAENGGGFQRRLFADDAAHGFAFIDLCRKRYDVVVMNPPFGEPTSGTLEYIRKKYPVASDNLLIGFLQRFHGSLVAGGRLGAITDRSWINKRFYEAFRRDFVLENATLDTWLDLGWGVLDANVEVAAHIHSAGNPSALFLNVSRFSDKAEATANNLRSLDSVTIHSLQSFARFPGWSLVYDLDAALVRTFVVGNKIGETEFTSYGGLKAGDAESSFRLVWEVSPADLNNRSWALFQNGSPYSPYYYGCYSVVRCDHEHWSNVLSYESSRITNIDRYFQPGIFYGKRTDWMYGYKGRAGQVPSMEGHLVQPLSWQRFWFDLLIINSSIYQEIANKLCGQHKYAGYINPISLEVSRMPDWSDRVAHITAQLEALDKGNEVSGLFLLPLSVTCIRHTNGSLRDACISAVESRREDVRMANDLRRDYNRCAEAEIDWRVKDAAAPDQVDYVRLFFESGDSVEFEAATLINYMTGVAFGRWDIRYATGERRAPELADPFAPLPACSPGMLQGDDGLPLSPEAGRQLHAAGQYPLDVAWDGILVEDPEHPLDLGRHVHAALQVLWQTEADDIEHEACSLLGVPALREWFGRPTGFFADHLRRYSKSRRQAPIYWPLSTASGRYTLWLYYPRLTDQTLYRAVADFVRPKLDAVTADVTRLQAKAQTGTARERAELEVLSEFQTELQDLHDELLRVAQLPWKPNLNDGVLITASPLWTLFRLPKWQKDLKACWEALLGEEYDWAHLAYSIWPERVREKCKTDRSLAVAHSLENLCEVSAPKPKAAKAKKTAASQVATPELPPRSTPRAAVVPMPEPRTVSADRPAPTPIDQTDRTEVMCIIRQVLGSGGARDRETALRDVAQALGFQRLGPRIRDVLHTDFQTAVRRGIIVNDNGTISLGPSDLRDCDRNSIKSDFLAAIGRRWIDRDEAIRLFARWLGYARTGAVIDETARSLINGLIREGRLDKDGDRIRRSS